MQIVAAMRARQACKPSAWSQVAIDDLSAFR